MKHNLPKLKSMAEKTYPVYRPIFNPPMKNMKNKDITFTCNDLDPLCGKLRVIRFDNSVIEICWLPPKRSERDKKCVVIDKNKLIKFLRKV